MSLFIGRICHRKNLLSNTKYLIVDKVERPNSGTHYLLVDSDNIFTHVPYSDLITRYTFEPPLSQLLDNE